MAKYRKKPVVIEAIEWRGNNYYNLKAFCGSLEYGEVPNTLIIPTLEGDHIASPGDFIIKGVKGEFYPCKPDIFKATYDGVE